MSQTARPVRPGSERSLPMTDETQALERQIEAFEQTWNYDAS